MAKKGILPKNSLQLLKPFLRANFQTGWEIELVYFMNLDADKTYTHAELASYLKVDFQQLGSSLKRLSRSGLLQVMCDQGGVKLIPDTSEKRALIALLAHAFSLKKLNIIRLIYDD
jgi:hypothetical protein